MFAQDVTRRHGSRLRCTFQRSVQMGVLVRWKVHQPLLCKWAPNVGEMLRLDEAAATSITGRLTLQLKNSNSCNNSNNNSRETTIMFVHSPGCTIHPTEWWLHVHRAQSTVALR